MCVTPSGISSQLPKINYSCRGEAAAGGGRGGGLGGWRGWRGGGETPAIPGRAPGATGEITVFEETDRIWRKTKA